MGERVQAELPEDCWEVVLKHMPHATQWHALSLTSRKFLLLTNRVRSSITITSAYDSLQGGVSRILRRFPDVKHVNLSSFHGDLGRLLFAISEARIPLKSLTLQGQKGLPAEAVQILGQACPSLRLLNCSRFEVWKDSDLEAIAEAFPSLEELDVSYPQHGFRLPFPDPNLCPCPSLFTDLGMESLASALTNLRSINVSGQHMVSDVFLEALALRCKDLEELIASDCPYVSDLGLQQVVFFCKKLKTLALGGTRVTPSGIKIAMEFCKSLSSLNLAHMALNNEVLCYMGDLHLPLKKLVLAGCKALTSASLLRLVRGCPNVEHLDLEGAQYLSDENMAELALNMQNVSFLRLNYCSMLTDTSFFCLLQSCRQLKQLYMESIGLGWVNANFSDPMPRLYINKLHLAWNKPVGDSTLKLISEFCPFLVSLDVSHCLLVTDDGVGALCRGCLHLKELFLKGCKKVHSLGLDEKEHSSLEQLELESSGFTDAGLIVVSKSFQSLILLGLEGCTKVTDKGVRHVIEKCKALKYINLKDCPGITIEALTWMVFCRPFIVEKAGPSIIWHQRAAWR